MASTNASITEAAEEPTTMTTDTTVARAPASQDADLAESEVARGDGTTSSNSAEWRQPRVRFGQAEVVGFLKPSSLMTDEERNDVWYPLVELDMLKTEARNLCRQIRDDGHTAERGLELRVCVQRQRNKLLAIRCLVKAQKFRSEETLAVISRRCTAWAAELAIVAASRDYCEAYHPALLSLVPKVKQSPAFPFSIKKRSASPTVADGAESQERCVRAKTNPSA